MQAVVTGLYAAPVDAAVKVPIVPESLQTPEVASHAHRMLAFWKTKLVSELGVYELPVVAIADDAA